MIIKYCYNCYENIRCRMNIVEILEEEKNKKANIKL